MVAFGNWHRSWRESTATVTVPAANPMIALAPKPPKTREKPKPPLASQAGEGLPTSGYDSSRKGGLIRTPRSGHRNWERRKYRRDSIAHAVGDDRGALWRRGRWHPPHHGATTAAPTPPRNPAAVHVDVYVAVDIHVAVDVTVHIAIDVTVGVAVRVHGWPPPPILARGALTPPCPPPPRPRVTTSALTSASIIPMIRATVIARFGKSIAKNAWRNLHGCRRF